MTCAGRLWGDRPSVKERARREAHGRNGVELAPDDRARLLLSADPCEHAACDDTDGPIIADPSVVPERHRGADPSTADRVEETILLNARGRHGPPRTGAEMKATRVAGENVERRSDECEPERCPEIQTTTARELESRRRQVRAEQCSGDDDVLKRSAADRQLGDDRR